MKARENQNKEPGKICYWNSIGRKGQKMSGACLGYCPFVGWVILSCGGRRQEQKKPSGRIDAGRWTCRRCFVSDYLIDWIVRCRVGRSSEVFKGEKVLCNGCRRSQKQTASLGKGRRSESLKNESSKGFREKGKKHRSWDAVDVILRCREPMQDASQFEGGEKSDGNMQARTHKRLPLNCSQWVA